MFKMSSNCRFVYISFMLMIPFTMFNTGCFTLVYSPSNMEERINTVDSDIDSLLDNIENLNATNQEYEKMLKELKIENELLNEERAELSKRQLAVESLQKPQKTELETHKGKLLKANKSIHEFEDKLSKLRIEKNELNKESVELSKKQQTIESLQKSHNVEWEIYKEELLKTRKSIQGFEERIKKLLLEEIRLNEGLEELTTFSESNNKENKLISASEYISKKK